LLDGGSDRLPFFRLYLEVLGGGVASVFHGQEQSMIAVGSRIVEPVGGWERYVERAGWGENQELIEDWFVAGDELQYVDTLVNDVEIDEPDRWERALHWVRSLLVAPRHRPVRSIEAATGR